MSLFKKIAYSVTAALGMTIGESQAQYRTLQRDNLPATLETVFKKPKKGNRTEFARINIVDGQGNLIAETSDYLICYSFTENDTINTITYTANGDMKDSLGIQDIHTVSVYQEDKKNHSAHERINTIGSDEILHKYSRSNLYSILHETEKAGWLKAIKFFTDSTKMILSVPDEQPADPTSETAPAPKSKRRDKTPH